MFSIADEYSNLNETFAQMKFAQKTKNINNSFEKYYYFKAYLVD
jgi:hypothetical protein